MAKGLASSSLVLNRTNASATSFNVWKTSQSIVGADGEYSCLQQKWGTRFDRYKDLFCDKNIPNARITTAVPDRRKSIQMKKKKTIFKDKRITKMMSNGGETGSKDN